MKLTLDHTQRLNLHALLGAQRVDVGSIRSIWAIQDRIALSGDEEEAIGLKRDIHGGQERVLWNPALSTPDKNFDFSDAETARIRVALQLWTDYGVASDRRWLEPLLSATALAEPAQREDQGFAPSVTSQGTP